VQINLVFLSLINFRKFITGDEKWVLYDNFKRRKWVDSGQSTIDCETQYSLEKSCVKMKTLN